MWIAIFISEKRKRERNKLIERRSDSCSTLLQISGNAKLSGFYCKQVKGRVFNFQYPVEKHRKHSDLAVLNSSVDSFCVLVDY